MKEKKITIWQRFLNVKPWYLFILFLISGVICVFALRANNEHMAQLRSDVYEADMDNGNVKQALINLQTYVTSHMNTSLTSGSNSVYPPIQLKYSYDRAVTSAGSQAQSANSNLYTEAENYCQNAIPNGFSGRYRIPCIEQYVESHGTQGNNIDQSLYEFDFISPAWSPDLAGWSLLVTVFLLFLTLLNIAVNFWLRKFVNK